MNVMPGVFVRWTALFVTMLLIEPAQAGLRAGAASVDITPQQFPVYVNGGFLSRQADKVNSRLYAHAIVLDDGSEKIAIVVVDSCMVPRDVMDAAKQQAHQAAGIRVDRILMSATHTHSAASCMRALGTPQDPAYTAFLIPRLAEAIVKAAANLEPARVGAAVVDAGEYTAVRRWIRRPDKMLVDPFGERTVRANMHPGPRSPDAIGPSGPEDPDLSVLSIQSEKGRPIALLANFANHYVGAAAISADYFGLFADRIRDRIAPVSENSAHPPFVAMMSQGTSGDVWLFDYFGPGPRKRPDLSTYTDAMVELAMKACASIEYTGQADLAMAQAELPLDYRTPDEERLEWARRIAAEMGDRLPKSKTEVYAKEALWLHEKQSTQVVLQAVRIGGIGITAAPNEVYALTGLKLKALSPLQPTINIELANGAEGYIPPPEQFPLGGYNTWPARSAALEIQAEPKIMEALTQLLEQVSGKPRREAILEPGAAACAIVDANPLAYWRLDEWAAEEARDLVGNHHGTYEKGVVFYLDGPQEVEFNKSGVLNRCPHFAGGRVCAELPELGPRYSVEMWFWNGLVSDARNVTGYLFSRGPGGETEAPGDHLGIGGTYRDVMPGRLFFFNGNERKEVLVGTTKMERWTWNHVVLVRDGEDVRVYLNGNPTPEINGKASRTIPGDTKQVFIGGRCDNFANFEGRIDEVAVYNRALKPEDLARKY